MQATILVVDDEAAARYALSRAFQAEFRVVEAGSAAEARERLGADRPDIVLLDYNMPGEDGMSLLRDLAAVPEPPVVIMITAHGSERIAARHQSRRLRLPRQALRHRRVALVVAALSSARTAPRSSGCEIGWRSKANSAR